MDKSEDSSKAICQYGKNCYRKNPLHFIEFSHPHLENILENGVNNDEDETNKYEIPEEFSMIKEIILGQLEILEKIYVPKNKKVISKKQAETNHNTGRVENDARWSGTPRKLKDNNPEKVPDFQSSKTNNMKNESFPSTSRRSPSPDNVSTATSSNKQRNSPNTLQTADSQLSKKPKIDKNIHDYIKVVLPKGQMAKKLEIAAPYNFFLTTITDSKPTHNEPLSITLQEILDESLGELESSVQINFMVDIGWLLGHYYFAGWLNTPLLVLYGDESAELKTISQMKPQVTAIKVNMSSPFATHHTKMMLLAYKDGSMRVVISTANLYEDDFHNRTQGIWLSPKLNALPDDADTCAGESPTNFRNDLMLYLVEYKISKIQPWIARIRKTDFSSINVFLVASCPGGHRESPNRGHPFGHARLGTLLGKHSAKINESCPIIAQSSSIGSLGPNVQAWIQQDFVNSSRKDSSPLGIRRLPQFKMIYPSFNNVKNSHDGMLGGGCLPYSKNTDDKQPWLKNHLYHWQSRNRNRNQAMPHIKTYCRWSNEGLYWFCLTSANLSKAAWGAYNKNNKIEPTLRINNYEAGVLFVPRYIIGEDTFPLENDRNGIPKFPMPYDITLKPYGPDDKPFLMDYLMSMGY